MCLLIYHLVFPSMLAKNLISATVSLVISVLIHAFEFQKLVQYIPCFVQTED